MSAQVLSLQAVLVVIISAILPCSNVMCGQLFCEVGVYQNVMNSITVVTVSVLFPTGTIDCKYVCSQHVYRIQCQFVNVLQTLVL